jgi:5-hydroxyisourate hydrolase-like protein (transthyretin family)
LGFLLFSLSVMGQQYHSFSGVVNDSITGQPIEGVDVVVKERSTGTITSLKGEFLLHLTAGEYEVTFSCNGYFSSTFKLSLNENIDEKVNLAKMPKSEKQSIIPKKWNNLIRSS